MVRSEMFRKRPKIKIFGCVKSEDLENQVNEFISNKDVEDIRFSSIVYDHICVHEVMVFYYE